MIARLTVELTLNVSQICTKSLVNSDHHREAILRHLFETLWWVYSSLIQYCVDAEIEELCYNVCRTF